MVCRHPVRPVVSLEEADSFYLALLRSVSLTFFPFPQSLLSPLSSFSSSFLHVGVFTITLCGEDGVLLVASSCRCWSHVHVQEVGVLGRFACRTGFRTEGSKIGRGLVPWSSHALAATVNCGRKKKEPLTYWAFYVIHLKKI